MITRFFVIKLPVKQWQLFRRTLTTYGCSLILTRLPRKIYKHRKKVKSPVCVRWKVYSPRSGSEHRVKLSSISFFHNKRFFLAQPYNIYKLLFYIKWVLIFLTARSWSCGNCGIKLYVAMRPPLSYFSILVDFSRKICCI